MPTNLLSIIEENLTEFLCVKSQNSYQHETNNDPMMMTLARKAKQHQNILGWNNFIRGYISIHWTKDHKRQCTNQKKNHGINALPK
jgi:hypothetical protein